MRNGHLVSNNQKHLISNHKKLKRSYKGTKDEVFGIGLPNSEAVFWYKPGACSTESLKPNQLKEETAAAEISQESS